MMRIRRGVPMPGEVLRRHRDPRALVRGHPGAGVPRDSLRIRAEAADADHRVVGVGVDVDIRREVEVDAGVAQLRRDGRAHLGGERDIVQAPQDRIARVGRALGRMQPGDIAALLVDRDERERVRCADRRGEGAQLLRGRGAHPFTAPPTMPLVIRPWTMRKKMMTGTATIVDAAIT